MRYYSRLQASESLQNKLNCVLRTWACQVTKKPTSSVKREKKNKRKEKWKERENSLHHVVRLPCTAGQRHNLRQLNAQQKYNAENRT